MSIDSHIQTCFVVILTFLRTFVNDRLNTRNLNDLLLASLPSCRLEVFFQRYVTSKLTNLSTHD